MNRGLVVGRLTELVWPIGKALVAKTIIEESGQADQNCSLWGGGMRLVRESIVIRIVFILVLIVAVLIYRFPR
jgi:hypothetical protein